jgi:class 3 adenylate cyclase/tetratricopeptide (TPR) repeat protein
MTVRRHLAAVWFADVVGFTELSGRDENAAFAVVGMMQAESTRIVEARGGRIVKFIGDAVLVTFDSTDAAVNAAFEFHDAFYDSEIVKTHGADLRIGMHLGEIVAADDGDIFGDGVNTASRIEGIAGPGEIFVSGDVARQLNARTEYVLRSVGDRELKGLNAPVTVYRLSEADGFTRPEPHALPQAVSPPRRPRGWARLVAALLAIVGVAYFWPTIFGPRSLVAEGLLDKGDVLVLASFGGRDQDAADLVTEALRVGLGSSPVFSLMEPGHVRTWLTRMEEEPTVRLTAPLAGEVVVRAGLKAHIEGSVHQTGEVYLITASVVSSSGDELVTIRSDAADDSELIDAIDELATDLRRIIGESVGDLRAADKLSDVTTASLPALRAYTRGHTAFRNGFADEAVRHLREAIAIDSTFAMAWSTLGPALQSSRSTEIERAEALATAFALRDRLSTMERYRVAAQYHDAVSGDVELEMQAYRNILELVPNRSGTLSNYGRALGQHYGDFQGAAKQMLLAIQAENNFPSFSNLVWTKIFQGDYDSARVVQDNFEVEFPQTFWRFRGRFIVEYHTGNPDPAWAAADSLARHEIAPDRWRSRGRWYAALADVMGDRPERALVALEEEVRLRETSGRPDLAAARLADLAWVQSAILGDTTGAQSRIRVALALDWSTADARTWPFFSLAREAARIGDVDDARLVMERWAAQPAARRGRGYPEDRRVVQALIEGWDGNVDTAFNDLRAIQESVDPRFPPAEWPSAHHCQRCYQQDLAHLARRAGNEETAAAYEDEILTQTVDLVETPLLRRRLRR